MIVGTLNNDNSNSNTGKKTGQITWFSRAEFFSPRRFNLYIFIPQNTQKYSYFPLILFDAKFTKCLQKCEGKLKFSTHVLSQQQNANSHLAT